MVVAEVVDKEINKKLIKEFNEGFVLVDLLMVIELIIT